MSGYYLLDNANTNPQYAYPRRGGARFSGTIIVHTAECAMDLIGVDSSAENCANFIRTRSDWGSYHRLVDSDSIINMLPFDYEAWQDTETNNWAVGISAAVMAGQWVNIPEARRDAIYRNLARAGAEAVRFANARGIHVPIRRISGAEARARVPGFCAHGDSGLYRSDPGQQFDWTKFLNYVAQELGAATPAPSAPQPTNPQAGLFSRVVTSDAAFVRPAPNRGSGTVSAYPTGISKGSALAIVGYVKGEAVTPGNDAWYKTKSGWYVWANEAQDNIAGLPYLADMSPKPAPAPAPAPQPAPAPVAPGNGKVPYCFVEAGDTGYGVAKQFGISFDKLSAYNPRVNWNALAIGQKLYLVNHCFVEAGDTGYGIAKQMGVSFEQLSAWNPGTNWNSLKVGQALWLE